MYCGRHWRCGGRVAPLPLTAARRYRMDFASSVIFIILSSVRSFGSTHYLFDLLHRYWFWLLFNVNATVVERLSRPVVNWCVHCWRWLHQDHQLDGLRSCELLPSDFLNRRSCLQWRQVEQCFYSAYLAALDSQSCFILVGDQDYSIDFSNCFLWISGIHFNCQSHFSDYYLGCLLPS